MNSYIVAVREVGGDESVYSLILTKAELADLLLNIDEDKFEIGDIISTYSEKSESILPFCKVDAKLTTGGNDDSK